MSKAIITMFLQDVEICTKIENDHGVSKKT